MTSFIEILENLLTNKKSAFKKSKLERASSDPTPNRMIKLEAVTLTRSLSEGSHSKEYKLDRLSLERRSLSLNSIPKNLGNHKGCQHNYGGSIAFFDQKRNKLIWIPGPCKNLEAFVMRFDKK